MATLYPESTSSTFKTSYISSGAVILESMRSTLNTGYIWSTKGVVKYESLSILSRYRLLGELLRLLIIFNRRGISLALAKLPRLKSKDWLHNPIFHTRQFCS